MVACLDGSPYSERTLAPAQRWSRAFGLPLWLVQVAPSEDPTPDETRPDAVPPEHHLDALARSLGGVEGWRVVHDRHPARALAAMAENVPVAAFVMTTHGRTGWSRVLVGSTGDHLGGLVHLEEPELAAAGDVEEDARRPVDRLLEER